MFNNQNKGIFFVFEGLDGSGQSTQVELLSDFLEKNKVSVVKTKEPTSVSPISKEIRRVLDEEQSITPNKLQEMFAKDRAWHLENVVIPALEQNKAIISDRYAFSSFAFGKGDGADEKYLLEINDKFLLPDIMFFLDTKPLTCVNRIKSRGKKTTLFEKIDKLEIAYQNFKYFLEKFKDKTDIYIINGEQPIEKVFQDIKLIVNSNKKLKSLINQ